MIRVFAIGKKISLQIIINILTVAVFFRSSHFSHFFIVWQSRHHNFRIGGSKITHDYQFIYFIFGFRRLFRGSFCPPSGYNYALHGR